MKIQQFTKPAILVNEDAVFACENFAFVIDGATGLLKENITDKPSDAQWFAETMKEYLMSNLNNTSKNLVDIMKEAIVFVDKKFHGFKGANNVKSKPSAGIAMLRKNGNNIEYFLLGDCTITIKDKVGKIHHLWIDDLPGLDKNNIEKMVSIAKEKNINVVDARPLISNELLETRLSQNTEKGYYILSNDTAACNHALVGKFPIDNIEAIYGVSDGFGQIFDVFEIYSKKELFNELKNRKVEEIYKELYDAQERDKYCNNYPRFKSRDDSSIFYIEF